MTSGCDPSNLLFHAVEKSLGELKDPNSICYCFECIAVFDNCPPKYEKKATVTASISCTKESKVLPKLCITCRMQNQLYCLQNNND